MRMETGRCGRPAEQVKAGRPVSEVRESDGAVHDGWDACILLGGQRWTRSGRAGIIDILVLASTFAASVRCVPDCGLLICAVMMLIDVPADSDCRVV